MTVEEFKELRPGDKVLYDGMVLETIYIRTSSVSMLGFGAQFTHNKRIVRLDCRFCYLYASHPGGKEIIKDMIKI